MIYEVPLNGSGRLAIAARPRGGDWLDDEVKRLRQHGVEIMVSALAADERRELGLETEAETCAAHGIEFVSLPIPDLGAPQDSEAFMTAVRHLAEAIHDGHYLAVHCRQSVGRSGLVAVAILIALGTSLKAAFTRRVGCSRRADPGNRGSRKMAGGSLRCAV